MALRKLTLLTDDAKTDMVNPYLIAILEEIESKLENLESRISALEPTM